MSHIRCRTHISNNECYELVKRKYASSGSNSIELFQTILSIAEQIGLDEALECLQQCVTEKRLAWFDRNVEHLEKTGYPLLEAYRIFYENYLGLSIPKDGQIVESTDTLLVTKWWNYCPTLEACQALGLDTREICEKVYHKPVQALLSKIDPRLRFKRNYDALRPYAAYCEEILTLEESE